MNRAHSLAGALLALLVVGYAPRLLAAPPFPPPPPEGCSSDDECDDGDLCNGAERCVIPEGGVGRCRPGVGRVCKDFDPCTADSCVENECLHTPIPDCPATTSTSTTSTTVTTSSTSTTTRPTSTTSTTDPSTSHTTTTTTTSTTVPGAACSPADAALCDDGDPCTVDSCSEAGTCASLPLGGVASVACTCDRALPAACQQRLPRRITRLITRGCRQARQAVVVAASRQGPMLRRAGRAFGGAARALGTGRQRALEPQCAGPLAAALRDARTRALAARELP
jgi:Dictyostelium (slime mold) repeat